MRLRAFTLIEILIVIVILSIVSLLVLYFPKINKSNYTILDLKELTYPSGTFYLFSDGSNLLVKKDGNFSLKIKIDFPEVFIYKNGEFIKKRFDLFINNKHVIFKYSQKNGIGDFFILTSSEGIFVFKPLFIKKFNSLESAENYFLLKKYQYSTRNFY